MDLASLADQSSNVRPYDYAFDTESILNVRSSRFHNITIAQAGSLRMLRFDTLGVEGLIVVENPLVVLFGYMRLQLLCLLWNSKPERVLVLGLGAGILPRILHYLSPTTLIDVVEIDAAVIDVARQYFYFHKNSQTRVSNEDGRERHELRSRRARAPRVLWMSFLKRKCIFYCHTVGQSCLVITFTVLH